VLAQKGAPSNNALKLTSLASLGGLGSQLNAVLGGRGWLVRRVLALGLLVLSSGVVSGGEYLLVISDHPDLPCAKSGGRPLVPSQTNWTVRTGSQVASRLSEYFRGDTLDDAYLMFRDGHFVFCGHGERATVHQALVDAAALSALHHEEALYDIAWLLASRQLRTALDQGLTKAGKNKVERRRLLRMKSAVDESLRRLTTR